MNIKDTTVENCTNPYGHKFYYLHRDNIKKQIAAIQAQRGVTYPSHVAVWRLRTQPPYESNYLEPNQGRKVRFPGE